MRLPIRPSGSALAAIAAAAFLLPGLAGNRLSAQSAVHPLAEAPSYGDLAPAVEYARAMLEAMRTERGTPGLSAAFGWADVESRVPVTPQTKFRVGSVSKPLTAAAMAILVERAQLDLDAPVQDYVPTFPQKRWPITSRQVAGHLAGVRHYDGEEFLSAEHYDTVLESLEICCLSRGLGSAIRATGGTCSAPWWRGRAERSSCRSSTVRCSSRSGC